ncbi:MAG: ATP-binding protein [Clostridiales bacterium]|nr:ATP-binding protein [Clostridiales bacterium]
MVKPHLLVVTGRPGAGKTTFSKELGKELFMPVISRDEIKEGYVRTFGKRHSELPEDTNKIVTDLFFKTINNLVSANVSLIAEAAFQHKVWEAQLNMLKEKTRLFILICKTKNDRVSLERFVNRGLNNPLREFFHGDKGVELARRGVELDVNPYDEPHIDVPTIYIETTGAYSPSIDELKTKVLDWIY